MKLKNFLNASFLLLSISTFSQNVASTASLTSGGLNAGTAGTKKHFMDIKQEKHRFRIP